MKTVAIEYPEALLAAWGTTDEAFEREAKLALAMKLFEFGRVTSGQAAALAGISRPAFLLGGERFGTPTVAWDAAEIAAELETDLVCRSLVVDSGASRGAHLDRRMLG